MNYFHTQGILYYIILQFINVMIVMSFFVTDAHSTFYFQCNCISHKISIYLVILLSSECAFIIKSWQMLYPMTI